MSWEYKSVFGNCNLRELGAQGWELVAIDRAGDVLQHVFKRPSTEHVERFTLEQREAFFAKQKAGGHHPPRAGSRLLNADIAALVRRVGHTQMLLLADKGFPVPPGPESIDLSLSAGVPTIPQVIEAIRGDFEFDRIIAAEEMTRAAPSREAELLRLYPNVGHERPAHVEFKHLASLARAAVRTGDDVPYANVILVGG
jgi:D-ribose pyranase